MENFLKQNCWRKKLQRQKRPAPDKASTDKTPKSSDMASPDSSSAQIPAQPRFQSTAPDDSQQEYHIEAGF